MVPAHQGTVRIRDCRIYIQEQRVCKLRMPIRTAKRHPLSPRHWLVTLLAFLFLLIIPLPTP